MVDVGVGTQLVPVFQGVGKWFVTLHFLSLIKLHTLWLHFRQRIFCGVTVSRPLSRALHMQISILNTGIIFMSYSVYVL